MEFDRVLRIKKASSFGIEFKTTEKDGIIFYISDERNVDFIALLVKDGKVNNNNMMNGREPWSNGYGRRLVFRRSWVRNPAPYTGWT